MARLKEKFKTYKNVFDEFTERTLFKLISGGYFEGLLGPISIGKESNVFVAESKQADKGKVVVKIYRLETCDFNRMYDYIKFDPRYVGIKPGKRKIVFAWAQREYRNLLKARDASVSSPTPIAFLNNVLVTEFIGNTEPSPKLKDAFPKKPKKFFGEVIDNITKLYRAGLVHSDLSGFNILNHHERPVFIDFSQATTLKNPLAQEFLERDIHNILTFFNKLGVSANKEEVKKGITKNKKKY